MGERAGQIAKTPEAKQLNSNSRVRRTKRLQPMDTPVDRILFLQRTVGNQAVSRLMRSGALQAKLSIGKPRDVYEQEADWVADAVMRMPEPGVQRQVEPEEEEEETLQTKTLVDKITPLVQVQRQEEPEEEEEMLQAKPLVDQITPLVQRQSEEEEEKPVQAKFLQRHEEEEEHVQAKISKESSLEVSPSFNSGIKSIRGGGQPLPESTRTFFEPRFGADFSGVRLHNNSNANYLARSINARAFTIGKDMVFGKGQYSPETSGGKKLLAHELTHVVQQQKHVLFKKHSNKKSSYIPLLKNYIQNNNKNIQMNLYDFLPSPTGTAIRYIINKIVDKWIPRNDPGRRFGQSLIEHYAFGMKRPYIRKDGAWGSFMKKRPELKNALNKKLKSIVRSLCMGSSDKGKVSDTLTGVKLHQLASMRMTLHGCHRIDIKGDFLTDGRMQCPCYVNFKNLRFTWVDKGDLHPGTKTELDDGKVVDDSWFKNLAKYVPTAGPYDIRITWSADSKWLDDGVNMNCLYGWPSNTPAPTEKRKRR